MKKSTYFVFVVMLFLTQTIKSQINLDEVVVTKKAETKATDEYTGSPASASIGIRYYYYPNLEAYFDLRTAKYIFKKNGEWVRDDNIPPNYRGYSLFNKGYVVLKGFVADNPYEFLPEHKKAYPSNFKGFYSEKTVAKNSPVQIDNH